MGMSEYEIVLTEIMCGKYTYMCCLVEGSDPTKTDHFPILDTYDEWVDKFGRIKARRLLSTACVCKRGTPNTPPPPPTGGDVPPPPNTPPPPTTSGCPALPPQGQV